MYFQQKSSKNKIRIFCKCIVTEIKNIFLECPVLKGTSFIIYNLINFGWYFSEWCEILGLRHSKVIPAKVLSPGDKNCYY